MSSLLLPTQSSQGTIHFSVYCPSTGELTHIQEVVSDIAYQNIPLNQLEIVLKKLTHRLVHLKDGTNKLYLQLGLQGGMMQEDELKLVEQLSISDPAVSNEVVADKILAAIPKDTYSSVRVYQVQYQFLGENQPKLARKIIITPSNWDWFVNVIKVIFSSSENINHNRAVKAILGSNNNPDKQQLVKAVKENFSFEILVSFDQTHFYFEPIRDWSTSKVINTCPIL